MITRLLFRVITLLTLTHPTLSGHPISKPGCPDRCGNITIPYPFGIGPDCYIEKSFDISCDHSIESPKPILTSINMELLEISFDFTNVHVMNPVIASNCRNETNFAGSLDVSGGPFTFSNYNIFVALGCGYLVQFEQLGTVSGGCTSICDTSARTTTTVNGSRCYGINCCRTTIPSSLQVMNVSFTSMDTRNDKVGGYCTTAAFIVDPSWFGLLNFSLVPDIEYVPAVYEWAILTGSCDKARNDSRGSVCSTNAVCFGDDITGLGYSCSCNKGYEGNPYLPEGCQDIDECADPSINHCEMMCKNKPGGYECLCPHGYLVVGYSCYRLYTNRSHFKTIIISTSVGLGVLFILIGGWFSYKVIKRRKLNNLKQKFFKRNGGFLLQQQLSSSISDVDNIKLFTSKELEKATDKFNQNRVLGEGAQGTVYKGMLIDGRIVAVKKSTEITDGNINQFINEIVILSQINHRNVVKLLGCCLETQVPLLVYEFVQNGTLSEYIRDNRNEDFPLTWAMRLRIATEVAGAIFYLHSSAASVPIFHRDVKSTNILLDEKYRAKISDFGASRSLGVDKTHLTTRVLGTFGYLDPEYFRSNQYTEKSDVYSFGVVLVELLTGEKAITRDTGQEEKSLAAYFLLNMERNRFLEIVDGRIVREGGGEEEEIMLVADLAKRCLSLNGKKRPTMKKVSVELEGIRLLSSGFGRNLKEDVEEVVDESMEGYWDTTSGSTSLDNTVST